MSTPCLCDLVDDYSADGLRKLLKYPSLKLAGYLRAFPEGLIQDDEDARVVVLRGVFYRREAVVSFAEERRVDVALRPEPENLHDPFAVAVDIDGVHAGYLPKEIAFEMREAVSGGRVRVAAHVMDFTSETPLIHLVVAWRDSD